MLNRKYGNEITPLLNNKKKETAGLMSDSFIKVMFKGLN